MDEKDMHEIEAMMTRVVGVFAEDVQRKFEILGEGQQMLAQRMDRLDGRMEGIEVRLERVEVRVVSLETKVEVLDKKVDALDKKVEGVAADLAEHRRDTEAHPTAWHVREHRE